MVDATLSPTGATSAARPDFGALCEAARACELGLEEAYLAWELAALAAGLDARERRAVELIVLASLVQLDQGSTRLPIQPAAERPLQLILERMQIEPADRDAIRIVLDQWLAAVTEARGDDDAPPWRFASLVGPSGAYRPLLIEDGELCHQRCLALEHRVVELLHTRLRSSAEAAPGDEALLADLDARAPLRDGQSLQLNPDQRQAVRRALSGRLTVITGGPGTGKTTVVVTIVRALAHGRDLSPSAIAMAAPTGKAADRMRQAVEHALSSVPRPSTADELLRSSPPQAQTLHRLLGFSPSRGRYRHHEHSRLAERVVIVDESSMMDLELTDRLLRALRDDAQLILLGDGDQLPSVQAGSVFRDLCEHSPRGVVRLETSYRMDPADPAGRNLYSMAGRIRAGRAADLLEPGPDAFGGPAERVAVRRDPRTIAWRGVEIIEATTEEQRRQVYESFHRQIISAPPELEPQLQAVVHLAAIDGAQPVDEAQRQRDRATLDRLLGHFESFRLLCVTRADTRPTGVDAVNRWFGERARQPSGGAGPGRAGEAPRLHRHRSLGGPWLVGEPVLIGRNDYARGLFNGDQGLVLRIAAPGGTPRLMVVFRRGDGFRAFPVEAVRPIAERAWASTVHKAQGAEYDHVVVVLPDEPVALLSREILYTALSRSRRSALMVGSRAMVASAVDHPIERHSGVASGLRHMKNTASVTIR